MVIRKTKRRPNRAREKRGLDEGHRGPVTRLLNTRKNPLTRPTLKNERTERKGRQWKSFIKATRKTKVFLLCVIVPRKRGGRNEEAPFGESLLPFFEKSVLPYLYASCREKAKEKTLQYVFLDVYSLCCFLRVCCFDSFVPTTIIFFNVIR